MNIAVFAWLCLAVFAVLVELATPSLFLGLSVFFGALAGALSSCYTTNTVYQIITFILIGLVSTLLLRRWVARTQATGLLATNTAALIGKRGVVVKAPTGGAMPGLVKIGGEVWTAYPVETSFKELFQEGDEVEIVQIKGCHVIIKNYKQN